jgi:Yip1 domain
MTAAPPPAAPVPATPAPEGKSALWLLFRVLDEPTQVFKQLAAAPRVLMPILAIFVALAVTSFATPQTILRQQAELGMQAAEKMAPGRITPEMRQQAADKAASIGSRVQKWLFGSIGLVVVSLIVALVLQGGFSLAGGEISFKEEWAIVLHAQVPALVGLLVIAALMPVTQSATFNLGLGFLISQDTSPFFHAFLMQITLFSVWHIYLLALGNQVKTNAKSVGGSLGIVISLWLVFALLVSLLGRFMPSSA